MARLGTYARLESSDPAELTDFLRRTMELAREAGLEITLVTLRPESHFVYITLAGTAEQFLAAGWDPHVVSGLAAA